MQSASFTFQLQDSKSGSSNNTDTLTNVMGQPQKGAPSGQKGDENVDFGSMQSQWRTWMGASFVQKRGIDVMKAVISDLKMGRLFDISMVLRLINDFVASCKDNEDHFVTLARLKDTNNYAYAHPVNVCIYSIAMGSKLGYNEKQLVRLGMAALLHDVGEVKLPERMLSKAAKFTESELSAMQRHPQLGYELLKRDSSIPEDVLLGVLHHHERLDGSGYPSGHVGRFIHPLGKIIALAETFDAMTSNRHSAASVPATEALKTLYSLSGKHYEPEVVNALITMIGMYPMGSLVRLSGGQLAVVLTKNKSDLSKPEVIIITDTDGQPVEPYIVNLYGDKSGRQIMYSENASLLNIDTNSYIQNVLLNKK